MKIFQPQAMHQLGKRDNQEDAIFPKLGNATENDRLFIVCDGMGGHESGEVASNSICQSISYFLKDVNPDTFSGEDFKKALKYAFDELDKLDQNPDNPRKMGTTLTFLYLGNNSALIAHIGDSRVYQLRRHKKGTMSILHRTEDHSLVNDLYRAGVITEEETKTHPRRNVITRAIQPNLEERPKATVFETKNVREGDYFFLCSDGVLESIDDHILKRILESNSSDEDKIEEIKKRCDGNSKDNNSAYLVRIKEGLPIVAETTNQGIADTAKNESNTVIPNNNTSSNGPIRTNQVDYSDCNPSSAPENRHSKLKRARYIGKVVGLVSTLVVVIGVGFWGVKFILDAAEGPITASKEISHEQQNSPFYKGDSIDALTADVDSTAPEYIKRLSPQERADVVYLKKNNIWNKDDLKSTRFIAIFNNLKNGNIEAIAAIFNGYDDKYVNSHLKNIIGKYKSASVDQKNKFSNTISDETIDIISAYTALSKLSTNDTQNKKESKKQKEPKKENNTEKKSTTDSSDPAGNTANPGEANIGEANTPPETNNPESSNPKTTEPSTTEPTPAPTGN